MDDRSRAALVWLLGFFVGLPLAVVFDVYDLCTGRWRYAPTDQWPATWNLLRALLGVRE